MATATAEAILRNDVAATEVDLGDLELTSLDALLPSLSALPHLGSLRLANNKLRELPDGLARCAQLHTLDLHGNPISGFAAVVRALTGLKSLRRLTIDLPLESDEDKLIIALPALEYFNGTALNEESAGSEDEAAEELLAAANARSATPAAEDAPAAEMAQWTARDTAAVEHLYADVAQSTQSTAEAPEFFSYMNQVVQHVTRLTGVQEDPLGRQGEVLKARTLLLMYCFEEAAQAVARVDPRVGQAVDAVLQFTKATMDQYDSHWRRMAQERDARLALMKKDMQSAIHEVEQLMAQATLARNADATSLATQAPPPPLPTAKAANDARGVQSQLMSSQKPLANAATTLESSMNQLNISPAARRPSAAGVSRSAERTGASRRLSVPDTTSKVKKVLTLKQLKDTIEEIYASKTKYDARCRTSHLPYETMEQHVYTYLNQRYGLKEIIIEWAAALFHAVQRYAAEDNDVAVFGKIVRNEVDEEFRYVQRQVRETVRELLRLRIRGKRPSKGDMEVKNILHRKMNGTVQEDEWREIVQYMYNVTDAAAVSSRIQAYLYRLSAPHRHLTQAADSKGRRETPALAYADLVRLLLDFQLEGHERFLAGFVKIFRAHDDDQNGIVNGFEFTAIVRELCPEKSVAEVEEMRAAVDPFGSQLITFSECVTFLSNELVAAASSAVPSKTP